MTTRAAHYNADFIGMVETSNIDLERCKEKDKAYVRLIVGKIIMNSILLSSNVCLQAVVRNKIKRTDV